MYQDRAADHGGRRQQEGRPHAKDQSSGQSGDIAGNWGDDHREELHQEVDQLGEGGEALDVRLELLQGAYARKEARPQQQQASTRPQRQDGPQRQSPLIPLHIHHPPCVRQWCKGITFLRKPP